MSKIKTGFKIYSRYDLPPQVKTSVGDISKSVVDYSRKDECDINHIMKRFIDSEGQLLINVNPNYDRPIYGDFSKDYTFTDVLDLRDNLSNLYDQMPEAQQKEFGSYNNFMDFVAKSSDDEFISKFGYKDTKDAAHPSPDPGTVSSANVPEASGSVASQPGNTSSGEKA